MNRRTTGKILIGVLALSFGIGTAAHDASAADTAFINRMSDQYKAFEKKHRDTYDRYLKNERHMYDLYLNQMTAVYNELLRRASEDLDQMTTTLENDVRQLKENYRESSDEFREYVRTTEKNRAGYAMDLYEDTMDPNHAGSPMDLFEDHLNPNSAGNAMDLFDDELNPDSAGSAMDKYEDDVNPNSADGVMDRFEDESSIRSAGSIMDRYEDGDLTKAEAEKRMAQALAKAEADMNKRIGDTRQAVQQRKNESLRTIRDAWLNAKNSILQQREKSIAEISSARQKLTGTGIEFPPLKLDDWITVVADGDYLIFEQPPVIVSGNTLVPMRAIFEKLGAEVVWNAKDKSIAADKAGTSIWLQINNDNAKIKNKQQTLEAAPRMMDGITMVPLRFVSEALGAKVQWDDVRKTITITSVS